MHLISQVLLTTPQLGDTQKISIAFIVMCASFLALILWTILIDWRIDHPEALQKLNQLEYVEIENPLPRVSIEFKLRQITFTHAKTNLWQKYITRGKKITLIKGFGEIEILSTDPLWKIKGITRHEDRYFSYVDIRLSPTSGKGSSKYLKVNLSLLEYDIPLPTTSTMDLYLDTNIIKINDDPSE